MEHDHFVNAVQKLRQEVFGQSIHDSVMNLFLIRLARQLLNRLATDIGGHDDDRVCEVYRASLAVGQTTVIKQLQENVEDVSMSFFDFVQQNHAVRIAAHGFRQSAAFFVSHITRRRADQASHAVSFHEFAHIDANHVALIIEHEMSQRLAEFCLADASRAEKHERSDWTIGITHSGTSTAHGIRNRFDSFMLIDHSLVDFVFHSQQLFTFTLHHA